MHSPPSLSHSAGSKSAAVKPSWLSKFTTQGRPAVLLHLLLSKGPDPHGSAQALAEAGTTVYVAIQSLDDEQLISSLTQACGQFYQAMLKRYAKRAISHRHLFNSLADCQWHYGCKAALLGYLFATQQQQPQQQASQLLRTLHSLYSQLIERPGIQGDEALRACASQLVLLIMELMGDWGAAEAYLLAHVAWLRQTGWERAGLYAQVGQLAAHRQVTSIHHAGYWYWLAYTKGNEESPAKEEEGEIGEEQQKSEKRLLTWLTTAHHFYQHKDNVQACWLIMRWVGHHYRRHEPAQAMAILRRVRRAWQASLGGGWMAMRSSLLGELQAMGEDCTAEIARLQGQRNLWLAVGVQSTDYEYGDPIPIRLLVSSEGEGKREEGREAQVVLSDGQTLRVTLAGEVSWLHYEPTKLGRVSIESVSVNGVVQANSTEADMPPHFIRWLGSHTLQSFTIGPRRPRLQARLLPWRGPFIVDNPVEGCLELTSKDEPLECRLRGQLTETVMVGEGEGGKALVPFTVIAGAEGPATLHFVIEARFVEDDLKHYHSRDPVEIAIAYEYDALQPWDLDWGVRARGIANGVIEHEVSLSAWLQDCNQDEVRFRSIHLNGILPVQDFNDGQRNTTAQSLNPLHFVDSQSLTNPPCLIPQFVWKWTGVTSSKNQVHLEYELGGQLYQRHLTLPPLNVQPSGYLVIGRRLSPDSPSSLGIPRNLSYCLWNTCKHALHLSNLRVEFEETVWSLQGWKRLAGLTLEAGQQATLCLQLIPLQVGCHPVPQLRVKCAAEQYSLADPSYPLLVINAT